MSKPFIEVKVYPNEDIENALRRLRKKCEKEGLFNEIKRRSFYEKPSEIRHRKALAAERRNRRNRDKVKGAYARKRAN